MDVENSYQVNAFEVTIGWSDADRQFYAQLVNTKGCGDEQPAMRQIRSPTDCLRMLDWLSAAIEELTGVVEFYPPHHAIAKLMDAPTIQAQPISVEDFLANPGQFMDSSGTLYPDGRPPTAEPFRQDRDIQAAIQGSGIPFEEFLQCIESDSSVWNETVASADSAGVSADLLSELHYCVDVLDGWQVAENDGIASEFDGTLAERQDDVLARTAISLILKTPDLSKNLTDSDREAFSAALNSSFLLDYEEAFSEEQRAAIDALTTSLCRSPLSGFPQAVARRYSPVSGLIIGSSAPIDTERLFASPETERLYEQFMSPEEAAKMVRIQRLLDLRDRTEADWKFLEERRDQMIYDYQQRQRE